MYACPIRRFSNQTRKTATAPGGRTHGFTCSFVQKQHAPKATMHKCAFLYGVLTFEEQILKSAPHIEKFGITGNPKGLHVKDFGYKKPVIHRLPLRLK